MVFSSYHEAWAYAQQQANQLKRPMGLEKATEYGKLVFRVKMIPMDPALRFGWETRCEVVDP